MGICRIDSRRDCLPIFTTNYDPAVESFCESDTPHYQLIDGFKLDVTSRKSYWDREVFDSFSTNDTKRNIVLFKMHGSADWVYVKSTRQVRLAEPIYVRGSGGEYANSLIYPAMRKIAMDDPYHAGYDYFLRCCEHARCLLVIGYSFRDYDALTHLKSAWGPSGNRNILAVKWLALPFSDVTGRSHHLISRWPADHASRCRQVETPPRPEPEAAFRRRILPGRLLGDLCFCHSVDSKILGSVARFTIAITCPVNGGSRPFL